MSVGVDLDLLTAAFGRDEIRFREGARGRQFAYLEGETVIRRLNEATGNQWSLEVKEISSREVGSPQKPTTLVMARVALTLPGCGTREHIGVQSLADGSGEDLVKGVITDALKKAATLFGVGLDLDAPPAERRVDPAGDPDAHLPWTERVAAAVERGSEGPWVELARVAANAAQMMGLARVAPTSTTLDAIAAVARERLLNTTAVDQTIKRRRAELGRAASGSGR